MALLQLPASTGDLAQAIKTSTLQTKLLLAVVGSAILALSAQISVPMFPVPMTMQTLAVLLIGAFYGARLGFATAALYLAEGAFGLPVFANGAGGAHHLVGPTAGYLIAFPFAAALVGYVAERGLLKNIFTSFATMIASHAVVFFLGVVWLTNYVGIEKAIAGGLTPFLLGTVVKSALAVAVLSLSTKLTKKA